MTPSRLWSSPIAGGILIGGALALGHAPFYQVWLAFPALVAFAIYMRHYGTSPKRAAWSGWIVGTAYFAISLSWIINPFFVEPEKHAWMAPFAAILLPAGLALFWAAGFAVLSRFAPPKLSWALGLIWAELARAYAFTGFPWGNVASFYVDTVAAQIVPVLGALGLSVVIIAVAQAVANVQNRLMLGVATIVAGIAIALPRPAPEPVGDGPLVRLVQPNAPQAEKWVPERAEVFYQRLLDATAAEPRPDVIVWPETSVPYLMEFASPILQEIGEYGRGVPVVAGINRYVDGRYFNSLITIDPDGSVPQVYDKRHLVPFGEYVPFGEVFAQLGIYGLAASQGGGFTAGGDGKLIFLPGIGAAVPLICYEGLFPALSHTDQSARLILLITNDAWFGPAAGPEQHLVQSQLRALEQGLPVVRVANTGITAMIDARGQLTARLPMNEQGHLDAVLPPQIAVRPLFATYGELPILLIVLISTGLGIAAMSRNRIDQANGGR